MLLYFGTSPKTVKENSIQGFARLISEFALDFRTAKERVESQRKKKQQKGTRGKMILEVRTIFWCILRPGYEKCLHFDVIAVT